MRTALRLFEMANPLYKGAFVTFYTVVAGAKTNVKATLYNGSSGSATLANPQQLDSRGKLKQATYHDVELVATIAGIHVPTHDTGIVAPSPTFRVASTGEVQYSFDAGASWNATGDYFFRDRGNWAGPGTDYQRNDMATVTGGRYIALDDHVSTASFATDLAAGHWRVFGSGRPRTVQEFGAVGDGATDDTVAIQAALDSGEKRIFAPAGTYLVSTVDLPSNMEFFGEGWSTLFTQKDAVNAPVIRATGAKTNIKLRDFKVDGNSANQAVGMGTVDGILIDVAVTDVLIERVWVDDVVDWNFSIQGDYVTLRECKGTNTTGATGPNGVRAPFLIGSGVPSNAADHITLEHCTADELPLDNIDGFILEQGSDIKLLNCRCLGVGEHTGFKIKTNNTIVMGCFANNPEASCGFQTQGPLQNLTMIGNIAYRNGGAGFQFNQNDTVTPGRNWVIVGNQAIDNGQSAALSFRYGFNFDNGVNCITDGVVISGNIAIDTQAVKTAVRGISFGSNAGAIYRRVQLKDNICNGNTAAGPTVDFLLDFATSSFEFSTSAIGTNIGLSGSSGGRVTGGMSKHNLHYWVDNVVAGAGPVTLMNSLTGVAGRGYVMPKAGWLVGMYSRSTAVVTAGQVSFRTLKNGVPFASGLVHNAAAGQIASVDESPQVQTFAAGDIINVDITPNAGLTPTPTNDFDVTVAVFY